MPRRIVATEGKKFAFRNYELSAPLENEVRVIVEYAAPKHGTESQVIAGNIFGGKRWDGELRMFLPVPAPAPGEDPAPAPFVEQDIGNIVVGRVAEIGSGVTRFQVGDRVFAYGPICEVHQSHEVDWKHLGDLSPEDAVCTDPVHVAFVAVRDGNIRIGDDVAVFGLGAIGLLTVQIAKASGARRVFAVDPFAMRREAALAFGATAVFDPASGDAALEIKLATEKAGVDVSHETSGNARALHEAIRCLRQCGTLVHVPWGPKEAGALHLNEEFHVNRPTIIGSQAVWDNADRSHPLWNEKRARHVLTQLFHDGVLTGQGIITPEVNFDEAPETLTEVFADPHNSIKVGVRFTP